MNNFPIFNPEFQNMNNNLELELKNIYNQINILNQEIKRLNRRVLSIEKNLIPTPYNKITPTPMNEAIYEAMNNNYSKDNYMI